MNYIPENNNSLNPSLKFYFFDTFIKRHRKLYTVFLIIALDILPTVSLVLRWRNRLIDN